MPGMKVHPKYKPAEGLTFEVEESDSGWIVKFSKRNSESWELGVVFPYEERAIKAGQAVLDYSFYKEPATIKDSKRTSKGTGVRGKDEQDEQPTTRKRPPKKSEKETGGTLA